MKQILWSLVLAGALAAQNQQPLPQTQPQDDGGDAPDHGVARISVVVGDVSVRRGDSGELTAAPLNSPIMTNDSLVTAANARGEVQFDNANAIRVAPLSEVRMGDLQDRRFLVQVAVGTTTFRVLAQSGGQTEISTPTVSVHPTQPGSYRVSVRQDGQTEITVRQGEAEIFSPRGSEILRAGQTMEARGSAADPEYMIEQGIPQDDWDRWNVQRDTALQQVSSSRSYVSPDIYGTEELDANGRWDYDPAYGNVWIPTVSAGWAPYREGRWVNEDYYGWTWLSADPFGWAPYHYGRWYSGRFGWAWYPGAIGSRYYWRPALVGFFGWGGGSSFGFGFGNVGWVPLAPFERYHPWYGSRFGGNFNSVVINNTNINNSFRNARFNGVTSVRSDQFGRGRVGSNNFVRASSGDLSRAGSVQGRMPFTATRESRAFSDRQVNTQALPRTNQNTNFYSRTQTPSRGGNSVGNNAGNTAGNGAGWRGLNGATSNGAATQNNVRQGNAAPAQAQRDSGWRGFDSTQQNGVRGQNNGAPAAAPRVQQSNPAQNNAAPQAQRDNGWRGFNGATPSPQVQRETRPQSTPQQQQPVRINPSIVRERAPAQQAAPNYNRPAPNYNRPAPAPAPSVNRSEAPRGGGGGGGARPAPSGGGGGGNRGGGGGGGNRGGGGGGGHRR